jgi:uncharacterized OB-fold protein
MTSAKPIPDVDDLEFAAYWRFCERSQLAVVLCRACGTKRWPPRPLCPRCSSDDAEWTAVPGFGKIYSWTTVGRSVVPGFEDELPYVVVIVELDDEPGLRFLGNLLDAAGERLQVGMGVEVDFTRRGDIALPQWRPVRDDTIVSDVQDPTEPSPYRD